MNKKFFIITLGCQMNISDSQRVETKLKDLGYKPASEQEAGLVIVNACSVRQKGIDRIWGGIKKWQAKNKKILITGCVLPTDKKKFLGKNVLIMDIKDLQTLESIIKPVNYSRSSADNLKSCKDLNYFNITPNLSGKIAYTPIMTGCDNFCSYCAVPYTRGREVSRPIDDIIAEVKTALSQGFKEIWLLGQNVNSFRPACHSGKDEILIRNLDSQSGLHPVENDNSSFITLLKAIDDLPENFKFNFISSNPQDMGPELIDCFAGLKKWTKELHLAMQSGDDEILRKMNRKISSKQFLDLVSNLKSKISDLKLSTDIIVGFPGETKKQFENTVKICKKVGFWKAYVNQYSPRAGTVSAKMPDDVTPEEKKRRWLILDNLINK